MKNEIQKIQIFLLVAAFAFSIPASAKLRVAILANHPHQTSIQHTKMKELTEPFISRGAEVIIIPTYLVSTWESRQVLRQQNFVAQNYDILVATGGEDIDPQIYKEKNTFSKNVNEKLDKTEMGFIKKFTDAGKGFFLGICRGHQLAFATFGGKLIQDIKEELNEQHPNPGEHSITLTSHGKNSSKLSNLIFETSNLITPQVTSTHHQAANISTKVPDELIVTAVDSQNPQIAEMIEFKNGRGLTVQFHPERMSGAFADAIYGHIVQTAQSIQVQNCHKRILVLQ